MFPSNIENSTTYKQCNKKTAELQFMLFLIKVAYLSKLVKEGQENIDSNCSTVLERWIIRCQN